MLGQHTSGAATVHWSKDFVEHLRTVHFTLVAVSVGLIIILARTNSPALSQIRQIIELKKEWPPEELDHYRRQVINSPPSGSFSRFPIPVQYWSRDTYFIVARTEPPKNHVQQVRVTLQGPSWQPTTYPAEEWDAVTRVPTTLAGFRTWWNGLRTAHAWCAPREVEPQGKVSYAVFSDPDNRSLAHPAVIEGYMGGDLRDYDYLHLPTPTTNEILHFRANELNNEYHDTTYRFVVRSRVQGSLDQEGILAVVNDRGWKWTKGNFERSFSALAQETKGLEFEDLEQVEKIIAERASKNLEEFESFGMKFPIAQLTVWGTVILLAVQLYLFLYLKQLSGKLGPDDPGWDVPWICMDQSFLARAIFFVSVIVLPVLAMLLLGARAAQHLTAGYWQPDSWHLMVGVRDWEWGVRVKIAVYALASVVALVLGSASWLFRPRLSFRTEEHCPAQLFE